MKACVLGAGSWGTALAIVLAGNGHETVLWGRDGDACRRMARERRNARYLPDHLFPDRLEPVAELDVGLRDTSLAVVAVPSHALRDAFGAIVRAGCPSWVVWATKGFDPDTGGLAHEVARELLGPDVVLGVLSGPTFAGEIAAGLPAAVTLACTDEAAAGDLAQAFRSERLRVYTSTDVTGVEVGGAIKNVLAVAAGIADGLGFGANARAALVTRGLVELMRLGEALGGRRETFMGLAGLGDLLLTCTDDQSRNRRFGLLIGRGAGVAEAEREVGQVVEGRRAAAIAAGHAARLGIEMPITAAVVRVLAGDVSPREAVSELLSRAPRPETAP